MLASDFAKHAKKLKFPVSVQAKFDGVRCLVYRVDGKVVLQSRRGDFYNVAHIQAELETMLPEGEMWDGELYIHGTSLQTITSLVRRPQPESKALQYHVYDIPSEPGDWNSRWNKLTHYGEGESVKFVDSPIAYSEADVLSLQKDMVADGFEGAIVRTSTGKYRFGARSQDLLKVKSFRTDEFTLVGWKIGKGRFETVPVFRCITAEGKEFDVAPKGTAHERAKMLAEADSLIGEKLTVRFFDFTDDGLPHFPVGIAIRYPEDL
jgi:DNA ligase-1